MLSHISRMSWRVRAVFIITATLLLALPATIFVSAAGGLTQLSTDPYTNTTSQHKTEVEPDNFTFGSTIVSVFQVGRFNDGGSSNTGWAASNDGGTTWMHGFLPGTTIYATPAGTYARVSDPTVVYDAAHNTWMASSLAIDATATGVAVIVNRSTNNGLTWTNPVVVSTVARSGFYDKDWIVCDNTSTSSSYGHCYEEWDLASSNDQVLMSTSTDGGATWGTPKSPANKPSGLGGQPLVQPNGTVVVPFLAINGTIAAFTSTNGGTSWNASVKISNQTDHIAAGNFRTEALPSAEIDKAGTIYVAWQDCRFETGCSANDIVLSTSTNGTTWSKTKRIPLDAVGSGVDHFIPGLGVDKTTQGTTAHLVLTYYYYSNANCTAATCQLFVAYASSTNGGKTWTTPTMLSGPMKLSWLPTTTGGSMVGDYIATSFSGSKAFPTFAVAVAPNGGILNESMYTTSSGLNIATGTLNSDNDQIRLNLQPTSTRVHTAY